MDKVLICTVGGSPEPVRASLKGHNPDKAVFICSGKDPVTGKPGSYNQITGASANSDIKRQLGDIPYLIKKIPADNLGKAVKAIQECLQELTCERPESRIMADYTGGTKTMSAALVLAVYDKKNVDLSLVTGPRTNQVKITSGESVRRVDTESMRISLAVEQSARYWKHFAYAEAAEMLAGIRPLNDKSARKVETMKTLGKAFDIWDRFDHAGSAERLIPYRALLASDHQTLLNSIDNLTREQTHPAVIPARLWDLWFNALRRAEQERYDDAVARIYRLLEWTAQWILQTRCEVDTANIDPQKIPGSLSIPANKKGQYQAGLMKAWELIGHHLPDSEVGQFGRQKLEELQHQISVRNQSILAHGYQPIGERDWHTLKQWFKDNFLELLERETEKAGLRSIPEQLPQQPGSKIRQFLQ